MIDKNKIVSITKAELGQLPAAPCNAEIRVVRNDDDVAEAVSVLRAEKIIGFDTETKPSFKRGQSHNVALIQLSTRNCCFLFRLNLIGLPETVKAILEDESIQKIGLSIHDDFHNLRKIYDLKPEGFIDLQTFVKEYGIADNSLSRIYGILFGHRISKGQRLSNWEAPELSPSQQNYAALDALACLHIYDYLKSGKFVARESQYYRDAPEPPQPAEKK